APTRGAERQPRDRRGGEPRALVPGRRGGGWNETLGAVAQRVTGPPSDGQRGLDRQPPGPRQRHDAEELARARGRVGRPRLARRRGPVAAPHRGGARFSKRPEVLYAWRQHSRSATRRDPRYL